MKNKETDEIFRVKEVQEKYVILYNDKEERKVPKYQLPLETGPDRVITRNEQGFYELV